MEMLEFLEGGILGKELLESFNNRFQVAITEIKQALKSVIRGLVIVVPLQRRSFSTLVS